MELNNTSADELGGIDPLGALAALMGPPPVILNRPILAAIWARVQADSSIRDFVVRNEAGRTATVGFFGDDGPDTAQYVVFAYDGTEYEHGELEAATDYSFSLDADADLKVSA